MTTAEKMTVVIPSLEPDERLVPYIHSLIKKGFEDIVVIDDGSGPDYQKIFATIKTLKGCMVLHHSQNKGKGCALKTGYGYLEGRGGCYGVVTADSDGQHTVEDVLKLAGHLAKGEQGLFLGARDFSMHHVPWKSFMGNRITSFLFWLLYGQKLSDTQTGLRGFASQYLPFMQQIAGERFEYEMNVLIACSREKIPMISVPIQTVYENNNEGSHFRAVRDAARIYKVLFGNFFRFAGVSIISFLLDQGLFHLFRGLLPKAFSLSAAMVIDIATVGARLISAPFNFACNRRLVFTGENKTAKALGRYILLALGIMGASALGVVLLNKIKVPIWLAKVVVDGALYFASYRIQREWVFKQPKTPNKLSNKEQ